MEGYIMAKKFTTYWIHTSSRFNRSVTYTWNDGPPWCDMPETYCCICAVFEIEAVEIKHCKSGLPAIWQAGLRPNLTGY